ncbi:hypothetical protein NDU88_006143 [Pleurodeles waltl]|uniref:Uncharacterized protein n=1 Tax=Pleurodeles waltl TaxID=8319 RepID=A0AAV7X2T9_PLEWA|nr:hypothetical protein NDU88_006143 [Pleurodeles waltl]
MAGIVSASALPEQNLYQELNNEQFRDGGIGDGEVPGMSGGNGCYVWEDGIELDYDEEDLEEREIVEDKMQKHTWWTTLHELPHGHKEANQRGSLGVLQQPLPEVAAPWAVAK